VVGVGRTETDGVGVGTWEEAMVLVRKKGYSSYLTLQLGFKILPPSFIHGFEHQTREVCLVWDIDGVGQANSRPCVYGGEKGAVGIANHVLVVPDHNFFGQGAL